MADWYEVRANSTPQDLWVTCEWDGKAAQTGPIALDDGREVHQVIADGYSHEIPFPVWFRPANGGTRLGDLLWTASALKIASRRLVEVLASIGATGFRTFPVDLRDHDGGPIPGYVGFSTVEVDESPDIAALFGLQSFTFLANSRVVDAWRAHGADQLVIEPYDPKAYQPWRETFREVGQPAGGSPSGAVLLQVAEGHDRGTG